MRGRPAGRPGRRRHGRHGRPRHAPRHRDLDAQDLDARAGAIRLPAGAFEWIDTGDPMPDGLDTVVVRERLLPQEDGSVLIAAGPDAAAPLATAGQHVRTAGEDFAAGEVLLPAGRPLRPGDLAAAAAAGHATLVGCPAAGRRDHPDGRRDPARR